MEAASEVCCRTEAVGHKGAGGGHLPDFQAAEPLSAAHPGLWRPLSTTVSLLANLPTTLPSSVHRSITSLLFRSVVHRSDTAFFHAYW